MKKVPNISPAKAVEMFMPTVESKLHAWVVVEQEGMPSVCCVWCEGHTRTNKQIVYVAASKSDELLSLVRAVNQSMKVTPVVLNMILSLYQSHNSNPVAEKVLF